MHIKKLMVIVSLLSFMFLAGCSNNTFNQRATSSFVIHKQIPKNIQLLDLQTVQLNGGVRVIGNLKFSVRKCRNSRPRGTLTLRVKQADGKEIISKRVTLNRRGRMSTYSQFDVILNGTLPARSHLHLSYES